MAIQPDGRIVAAGFARPVGDVAVIGYNRDDSPDTTFDSDGMMTTDLGGFDGAWDMALQTDGKLGPWATPSGPVLA